MHQLRILILVSFLGLTSFATARNLGSPARDFQDKKEKKHKDRNRGHKAEAKIYPLKDLGIPKGHLPPPGECKIWIPGLPPGQQGPPESCGSAFANVPIGAWVITHTGDRYKVNVFSQERPLIIVEVRFYALL